MSEKTSKGKREVDVKALAATALEQFHSKTFGKCVENLTRLESAMKGNVKVMQNKAVAELFKSDFKKHKQFGSALNEALGKMPIDGEAPEIKDLNLCTAYFNRAIVLFQSRQPQSALKILLNLLRHLNVLDDLLAQKVGLLAVNLLLNTNQPKKAEAVVELLKVRLSSNSEFNSDEDDVTDLLLDKTKPKPIKSLEHFRWMLRFYKLRTKVLNEKPVLIPFEETTEMLVLKAHQYYCGHDYQMAAKELTKRFKNTSPSVMKNGEDYNTVIANNMGLIHFHVKHYALAVRFFQHALTFDQTATDGVGANPPLHCLGASKRPEILYNLGIAMLHLQRPMEAFECLLIPLTHYHNNPRLWLRLAEACIMVHKQNAKSKEQKNIVSSVVGSGMNRKYIVRPTAPKYVSEEGQSFAIPSTNLEFASLCLRNALTLVEHYEGDFRTPQSAESKASWTQNNDRSQCNPSKALSKDAFVKLKCAVLTAYSYVQICLGEYILALKCAQELVRMPELPDALAMLAHLYCAESLIMLDRLHEAQAYLELKFIAELKEDDFIHRGSPDWSINSLEGAQSILKYNLAVVLTMAGEYDLARTMIMTCKHPIVFTKLKMLKMYIEMKTGNFDNCRLMVRVDTPQHY